VLRKIVCILAIILGIANLLFYRTRLTKDVSVPIQISQPCYILDAGHGGEDGGAVSVTGVPESGINLAIVLKMDDIFGLLGHAPLLIREDDLSLHDKDAVTLREKKVSDLMNRTKLVNACTDATLISIHQNSYPSEKYNGTHVFYAATNGSKELATQIQTAIRNTIQPDNGREVKQIPKNVYLMNHVHCRAALVECGFLTHPQEEALLRNDIYQKKLAAVLTTAILNSDTSSMTDHLHSEQDLL